MTAPKPPRDDYKITSLLVKMIREGDISSAGLCQVANIKVHAIKYYLRHYIEDGRIKLIGRSGEDGRRAKLWAWTEGRPHIKTSAHKCLSCRITPVPGGTTWVCQRCKSKEAWSSASPYAIA